jgi:hypothetical protein
LSDRSQNKEVIPFATRLWYKIASGEPSSVRRILEKSVLYLPLYFFAVLDGIHNLDLTLGL